MSGTRAGLQGVLDDQCLLLAKRISVIHCLKQEHCDRLAEVLVHYLRSIVVIISINLGDICKHESFQVIGPQGEQQRHNALFLLLASMQQVACEGNF